MNRLVKWKKPLLFLIVCLLAFGPLIPWLGLYWDDWPVILTAHLQAPGAFWDYYSKDRPNQAWAPILLIMILGKDPLVWQVASLVLRWVSVCLVWWFLSILWPSRKKEAAWTALLFAIYPVFTHQPLAVTFSQAWFGYALFLLSLGAMVLSVRQPGRRWLWMAPAISLSFLLMWSAEYFIGLELLRPWFIWIAIGDENHKNRLKKTLLHWVPYLIILLGIVVWRLFFIRLNTDIDPNRPTLFYEFAKQPFAAIVRLLQLSLQDTIHNVLGVWYGTIEARSININDQFYLISLAIGAAGALSTWLLLSPRFERANVEESKEEGFWHRQAIGIGLLGTVLGPFPVWLTNRQVLEGLYGSRFGLAGMLGFSILVVGLLGWLSTRRFPKLVIIGLLVGASIGFHIRSADTFKQSWAKQHQFFWQLFWRAPYIEPQTAIVSVDELFLYVGRPSTSMALNALYPQPKGSYDLDYWFVEAPYHIRPDQVNQAISGMPYDFTFRIYTFKGNSLDSILIDFAPEKGNCLWLLNQRDVFDPEIPGMAETLLPLSNLDRIAANPLQEGYPVEEIFGKEPAHTWCYYYEKAELAGQLGDWEKVIQLFLQAQALGYKPGNPHEWIPFIKGMAYKGAWGDAVQRTSKLVEKDPKYAKRMCTLWVEISAQEMIPEGFQPSVNDLFRNLGCR